MKTKISLRNIISYSIEFFIVSIFCGAVVFGGVCLFILGKMGIMLGLPERQLLVLTTVFIASITYLFWHYKHYREIGIWELSGGYLHRGDPNNLSLDLSTIEKVIPGLPKSRWHNFFFGATLRSRSYSIHSCTLTLMFNNNKYLPLYLFELGGGLEMMNELARILTDKIDPEHAFNQAERKALKPRAINKVVQL